MINLRKILGDLSVSRHLAVAGNANVSGGVTVGRNLKVGGWLDAPNIKHAYKGLFPSAEALAAAYPRPLPGWYATVAELTTTTTTTDDDGNETTTTEETKTTLAEAAVVYMVTRESGKWAWTATGLTTTEVNSYVEEVEQSIESAIEACLGIIHDSLDDPVIDICHLDDISVIRGHSRFRVVRTTDNVTYNVGYLDIFGCDGAECVTQVLVTHEALVGGDFTSDDHTHADSVFYMYARSMNTGKGDGDLNVSAGVWTAWSVIWKNDNYTDLQGTMNAVGTVDATIPLKLKAELVNRVLNITGSVVDPEIDIDSLDTLNEQQDYSRWAVTRTTTSGVACKVGMLDIFTTQSYHAVTQVFVTNELLVEDEDGNKSFNQSHSDGMTYWYERHYNCGNSTLENDKDTWSAWRLVMQSDNYEDLQGTMNAVGDVNATIPLKLEAVLKDRILSITGSVVDQTAEMDDLDTLSSVPDFSQYVMTRKDSLGNVLKTGRLEVFTDAASGIVTQLFVTRELLVTDADTGVKSFDGTVDDSNKTYWYVRHYVTVDAPVLTSATSATKTWTEWEIAMTSDTFSWLNQYVEMDDLDSITTAPAWPHYTVQRNGVNSGTLRVFTDSAGFVCQVLMTRENLVTFEDGTKGFDGTETDSYLSTKVCWYVRHYVPAEDTPQLTNLTPETSAYGWTAWELAFDSTTANQLSMTAQDVDVDVTAPLVFEAKIVDNVLKITTYMPEVTSTQDGYMTAADKIILDKINGLMTTGMLTNGTMRFDKIVSDDVDVITDEICETYDGIAWLETKKMFAAYLSISLLMENGGIAVANLQPDTSDDDTDDNGDDTDTDVTFGPDTSEKYLQTRYWALWPSVKKYMKSPGTEEGLWKNKLYILEDQVYVYYDGYLVRVSAQAEDYELISDEEIDEALGDFEFVDPDEGGQSTHDPITKEDIDDWWEDTEAADDAGTVAIRELAAEGDGALELDVEREEGSYKATVKGKVNAEEMSADTVAGMFDE